MMIGNMEIIEYNNIPQHEYEKYISEWEATGEIIVPMASARQGKSFAEVQKHWQMLQTEIMLQKGFVPSTLYFLVNEGRILGAISFRHQLIPCLLLNGGHIGYGIRPSERGKGYATVMLKLLLQQINPENYPQVMLSCDEDNPASAKTIENCGGVLQDKVEYEGVMTRRYWIRLN